MAPRRRRAPERERSAAAFDIIMSGNATPSQMGALLMALRVRGETVDEITGAARTMRAKALTIERAARHDRHLRHRRRRRRHASTSRPPPRSSSPAAACRSPSTATARCRRKSGAADVLTALGVNIDAGIERGAALPAGGRHRLSDGAAPSQRHAPCRADPGRARHAHDLQPARPAVQPGRGAAPARRRLRAGMGRADGRGARPARQPSAPGSCMATGIDELTTCGHQVVAELKDGKVADFRGHARGWPG